MSPGRAVLLSMVVWFAVIFAIIGLFGVFGIAAGVIGILVAGPGMYYLLDWLMDRVIGS